MASSAKAGRVVIEPSNICLVVESVMCLYARGVTSATTCTLNIHMYLNLSGRGLTLFLFFIFNPNTMRKKSKVEMPAVSACSGCYSASVFIIGLN